MSTPRNYQQFSEVLVLAFLWGPAFLWTVMALEDLAPITLVSCRVGLAGFILLLILFLRRISLRGLPPKLWLHSAALGFFTNGLPFLCFAEAVRYIPISLAALINGTTPILTILLANVFLDDERLSRNRLIGIALGLAGFLIIALPRLFSQDGAGAYSLYGTGLVFLASASYAIGIVYAKKVATQAPPLVIPPCNSSARYSI